MAQGLFMVLWFRREGRRRRDRFFDFLNAEDLLTFPYLALNTAYGRFQLHRVVAQIIRVFLRGFQGVFQGGHLRLRLPDLFLALLIGPVAARQIPLLEIHGGQNRPQSKGQYGNHSLALAHGGFREGGKAALRSLS